MHQTHLIQVMTLVILEVLAEELLEDLHHLAEQETHPLLIHLKEIQVEEDTSLQEQ